MAMTPEVHWHEGLFLQPHHLQSMQRSLLNRLADERRMLWPYGYGVVHSQLAADALENLQLTFDSLRVIMPTGVVVDIPGNADLPALDIKQAFESSSKAFTVSLGIPLWHEDRGNSIELGSEGDWRVKRIFRVTERERSDENTGENPQPVLFRRINARLLLDGDDRTDLEVLPLIRIAHSTGQGVGLPRMDRDFIPPCVVISAWPTLRDLVREVANAVDATRRELALTLSRGGFNVEMLQGPQFESLLRLQTLSRYSARLPHLLSVGCVTPFQVYMELRTLLAELAAMQPATDVFTVVDYDHDNPAVSFQELCQRVIDLIKRVKTGETFISAAFEPEGDFYTVTMTEEHFSRPMQYFLGIKTAEDPRQVAALVEDGDKFKMMARSLVKRNLFGIKLKWERQPPVVLPAEPGLHYFELLRSESQRMWDKTKMDSALSITWRGSAGTDFAMKLYMPVPN